MDENFVFVEVSFGNEWGYILINFPDCLFGTKVNNALDACW